MYHLYKAQIRTVSGDYITTQKCNIITSDIEWSRNMLYAELQPDFLPEIIVLDVYYTSVEVGQEERFEIKDRVTSFNPQIHNSYGMQRKVV